MRPIFSFVLLAGVLLGAGREARSQSASGPGAAVAVPPATATASQPVAPGGPKSAVSPALPPVTDAGRQTEKQRALASQADRLVAMANELKAQVDLTNKNILSLTVVRKAQEIEALAKGMKEQAKKGQ
jgi:hypothetical protein